jgi:dUTP pyrophosphatase
VFDLIKKLLRKIKMTDTLKVCRVRNVKLPVRATSGSCGYDLFIPQDLVRLDFNKMSEITKIDPRIEFDFNTGYLKNIFIGPGEEILIPSGIKVRVPKGHAIKIENKSSIATVKDLIVGACIIDQDYEGEVLINLHNVSNKKIAVLQPNDKMCQMVLYKIDTPEIEEVETPTELFKGIDSDRKDGGFGSTGN